MAGMLQKLKIDNQRTCSCPPNHLNCMDAKYWMKSQVALWEFSYNGRDLRDKNLHPAVFPVGLPKKVIELFSHKGELVLDPFVGSGTTLVAAQDLERNAVGFDLKKEYVDLSYSRLKQSTLTSNTRQLAIKDNAVFIAVFFTSSPSPITIFIT